MVQSEFEPRPKLCQLCSNVNIEKLASPQGYKHHRSIAECIASANDCQLCSLIMQELRVHLRRRGSACFWAHLRLQDNEVVPQSPGVWLARGRWRLFEETDIIPLKDESILDHELRYSGSGRPSPHASLAAFTEENDLASDAYHVPWRRKLPGYT